MISAAFVLAIAVEAGELRWSAPPGCPSEAEVAALLEQEGGADADVETSAVVRENDDGTWSVAIEIRRGEDVLERTIALDSCAAAAEAVALVYALALEQREDAVPEVEPEPVVPEVAARDEPPPPPRVEIDETPPPPPRSRPRPRFAFHFGGGGGVGTLPRGGGHVLAGFAIVWRWARLGVRVDHAIVRSVDEQDATANVSSTTGGIDLAIPIPVGPIELLPAIDVRAGAVRARGDGAAGGAVRWVPWVLAGAGLSLAWMPSWWGLRVGAELEVPFLRHTFTFDTLVVARTQRVGGLFWAGPEFRFPAPR